MSEIARNFDYRVVGAEGLEAVRPLWEQLRTHHAPWSSRFAGEPPSLVFEPRKQELLAKSAGGKIRVELVKAAPEGADVAYCVSTVSAGGHGELDSMFVEARFRGRGIGSELIRRSLAWQESMGASSKVVVVAYANEEALALYRRFGFQPRTLVLQQGRESAG